MAEPDLAPSIAILTAIGNAIRSKTGGGTTPIPVSGQGGFAERIKLIPRPATDVVRTVAVSATELTQTEMNTQKRVRCNGLPAFETPPGGTTGATQVIFDAFKRDEWQATLFPPPWDALNNAVYREINRPAADRRSSDTLVGDKLYMAFAITTGGPSGHTSVSIINTRTGVHSQITGLPSGQYSGTYRVGTKLYLFRARSIGTIPSYNQIYRINTIDDTFITITLGASRPYISAELVGNRLYFVWEKPPSTLQTDIPFINTTDDTPGMTTGLVARVQQGLYVADNKLFVTGEDASTSINVITGTGGTAPNYTTWTVSVISNLPNRIWSERWVNYAEWCRAGDFLYVSSSEAATSILRIQHKTAANTTTEITGLANVQHRPMMAVGTTKVYVGSNGATTELNVITNSTGAVTKITPVPSRAYNRMRLVGTKLYIGSSSAANISFINTSNDSFTEVASTSIALLEFYLNGTNLYLINGSSTGTSHIVINTNDDTIRARVSYPQGGYRIQVGAPVSKANPEGGLYLSGGGTLMLEIDFASVNERPSGATWPARQIALPRNCSGSVFVNEKIWIGDSGSNQTNIVCLTKSVLPSHPSVSTVQNVAPFVYVRY